VATAPPIILTQPFSHTLKVGSAVFLSVRALGVQPFTYQWFFGTNAIDGATNATFLLRIQSIEQSGAYSVVVGNSAGTATSGNALINVLPASIGINLVPRLSLQGSLGTNYQIQFINSIGPTDAWQTLTNVTITNLLQYFYDDSAVGQPQRFYRLMQSP